MSTDFAVESTAPANGSPSAPKRRGRSAKPAAPPTGPTAEDYRRAAMLLKMTADGTRLRVLDILIDGSMNVGTLCRTLGGPEGPISQPAVSHHLALLRHARLIEPTREGKTNVYSLTDLGRIVATLVRPLVRDGSAR